ncbi:MAG TPA: MFS transporter [Bacilli bacterium]|nr:MFS transporter [Bacilli bacterium]
MNRQQAQTVATRNIKTMFWTNLLEGVNFLGPVLILLYASRGLDTAGIYWVTLSWSMSVLLFEVPTGAFADRFGPKASFLMGSLTAVFSTLALLFANDQTWVFYLSNVLSGLAATFFSGSKEALIYENLKEAGREDEMSHVMGKLQTPVFLTSIVTVLFGAYLARDLTQGQFNLLIGLTAAAQLLQLALFARVINPTRVEEFRDNPFQHVRAGMATLRKTPNLVLGYINITVVFIAGGILFTKMEQPYLIGAGVPTIWLGVLYAIAAVIGLVFSEKIGWLTKKMSRITWLHLLGLVAVIAPAVAAFTLDSAWAAVGVFLLMQVVRAMRYPIFSEVQNEYIPTGSRATTLSLLSILDSFFDLVLISSFATIAGFVHSDLKVIFLGASGVALLGVAIPLREAKKKQLREQAAEAAATDTTVS